ncbi:MAG: hypothetical protein U0903_09965 [Planctomycetales bacterium]
MEQIELPVPVPNVAGWERPTTQRPQIRGNELIDFRTVNSSAACYVRRWLELVPLCRNPP